MLDKKKNLPFWIIIIIALLSLILKAEHFQLSGIDKDQVFQFDNCKGPFKPFWQHYYYGDHTTFPGEYIITYPIIAYFGLNPWALALPKVIINIFGLFLLFKLCQEFKLSSWASAIPFLMICFNETLLDHNYELRPYSVLPTLALLSLYLSLKIINPPKKSTKKSQIIYVLSFIFISMYHAYGIIMISSSLLFAIIAFQNNKINSLKSLPWKFIGVIWLISLSIWLWYSSSNHCGMSPGQTQSHVNTFDYIHNPSISFFLFIKDILGNLLGHKIFYILLIGWSALFFSSRITFQQWLFLLILIILPINIILYADIKNSYWFIQRQFIWVMPLFALLTGWLWNSFFLKLNKN